MAGRLVKPRAAFTVVVVGFVAALVLMVVAADLNGVDGDDAAPDADLSGSELVQGRSSEADTTAASTQVLQVTGPVSSDAQAGGVESSGVDSTGAERSGGEWSDGEPIVVQAADVVAADGPPIGSIVEVQDPIEGSYLVLFRDTPKAPADTPAGTSAQVDAAQAKVDEVMAGVAGEVTHVYRGVPGVERDGVYECGVR